MGTSPTPPPRGNGAPAPPKSPEFAALHSEFEELVAAMLEDATTRIVTTVETFVEPYLRTTTRLHAELRSERAALRWTLAGLWIFPLALGLAICLGLMVGASMKEAPPPALPAEQLDSPNPPPLDPVNHPSKGGPSYQA